MKKLIITAAVIVSSCFVTPRATAYNTTVSPTTVWCNWQGWGFSLAWWGKGLGSNTTLADMIFTTNYVTWNGANVPGLAMNIARYNVGACSSNSYMGASLYGPNLTETTKMDAYWTNWASSDPGSSSWGWLRDPSQRALLLNAQARGANKFELFANSPVWWMCYNHDPAGSTNGTSDNLQSWNYDQFAVYLATVAKFAQTNWGVTFTSVEAFNEPSAGWWKFDGSQEGCHFDVGTQESVLSYLRTELNNRGLNSMLIAASDENTVAIASNTWNSFDSTTRGYVNRINAHGYGYETEVVQRSTLYDQAHSAGKDLWMSEYGEGDVDGSRMVENIGLDFAYLHPTAWIYWQPNWGPLNCTLPNLPTTINTKWWALAQYTRHVRPGMQILDSGNANVVSAYDLAHNKLVLVCGNLTPAQSVTFMLTNFTTVNGPITRWQTQMLGGSDRYTEYTNDTFVNNKQFTSSFTTNTVQTFEVQNVMYLSPFVGPIAPESDGSLDIFGIGSNGDVWNDYETNGGAGWANWNDLGSGAPASIAGPVAARNLSGNLEVFAVGSDGNVWHDVEVPGGWSGWSSLGGGGVTNLAAAVNGDGRVQIFGIGASGILMTASQSTAGSSTWSGWSALGGTTQIQPGYVVGQNKDGRLELFARIQGSNGDVFHLWESTSAGTNWTSSWADIAGTNSNPRLAVARNLDGRLQVFAVGGNGVMYSSWQNSPGGSWSGWSSFGTGKVIQPGFVVGQNLDGRLEAFAKGSGPTADVFHLWQSAPSSSWTTNWADMGATSSGVDPQLVAGDNGDGRMQIFAIGTNSDVWSSVQISAGGSWNAWTDMGGAGTMFYSGQP